MWVQYFDMITLLKDFIETERSGDFEKNLYTIKQMLPYFYASGHFHYVKSAQIYLQTMSHLEKVMEKTKYNDFVTKGYFTIILYISVHII